MAINDDIQTAMIECAAARADAAAPLTFNAAADTETRQRSESQFRANLPLIPGGWQRARPNVLKASTMLGHIGKAIAQAVNPDATQITLEQTKAARTIVEHECRFTIAQRVGKDPGNVDVSDGIICGGE